MGNNSHNIKRFRSKHLSQVIVVDTGKENQEESEGWIIQDFFGWESLNSTDTSINNGNNQMKLEEEEVEKKKSLGEKEKLIID